MVDGVSGNVPSQITSVETDLIRQLEDAKQGVKNAGGVASQDTIERINQLEAKILKYVENAKARLEKTTPGNPQLPEASDQEISEEFVKLAQELFSNASSVVVSLTAAVNDFKELNGLVDKALADNKGDSPLINFFLKGSSLTALNIAIQELSKLLSQITEQEQKNAKLERQAERDAVQGEANAIMQEAELKKQMHDALGKNKYEFGMASAGVGLMGAGTTIAGRGDERRYNWRAAGETAHAASGALNAAGEGQANFIQRDAEKGIAEQEATRTVMRDRAQSIHNAVESSRRIVSESRDMLTKLLDQLQQLNSKAYQINLSRNG